MTDKPEPWWLVLGVEPTSSVEDVLSAFGKQCKTLAPALVGSGDEENRETLRRWQSCCAALNEAVARVGGGDGAEPEVSGDEELFEPPDRPSEQQIRSALDDWSRSKRFIPRDLFNGSLAVDDISAFRFTLTRLIETREERASRSSDAPIGTYNLSLQSIEPPIATNFEPHTLVYELAGTGSSMVGVVHRKPATVKYRTEVPSEVAGYVQQESDWEEPIRYSGMEVPRGLATPAALTAALAEHPDGEILRRLEIERLPIIRVATRWRGRERSAHLIGSPWRVIIEKAPRRRLFYGLVAALVLALVAAIGAIVIGVRAAQPEPVAAQPERVLFADDFEKNQYFGVDTVPYRSGYIDGRFFMDPEDGRSLQVYYDDVALNEMPPANLAVEVTVLLPDDQGSFRAGISCRITEDSLGYSFVINQNGSYNISKYESQWRTLASGRTDIDSSRSHNLRAVCNGSNLAMYVDGELIASAKDTDYPAGSFGLIADSGTTKSAAAYFDDLKVTEP